MMDEYNVIGVPLGTRLLRVERLPHGWRLWIATKDYKHGTFLLLSDYGSVVRVTVREDEGDDVITVRPNDDAVNRIRHHDKGLDNE